MALYKLDYYYYYYEQNLQLNKARITPKGYKAQLRGM